VNHTDRPVADHDPINGHVSEESSQYTIYKLLTLLIANFQHCQQVNNDAIYLQMKSTKNCQIKLTGGQEGSLGRVAFKSVHF